MNFQKIIRNIIIILSTSCVSAYAASNMDSVIIGAVTPSAGTFTNIHYTNTEIDTSYSTSSPSSGGAVTIPNNSSTLLLTPASALASLTITMPSSPSDGQIERFSSNKAITALTVSPSTGQSMDGGQPTTLGTGGGVEFIYRSSVSTWSRIY